MQEVIDALERLLQEFEKEPMEDSERIETNRDALEQDYQKLKRELAEVQAALQEAKEDIYGFQQQNLHQSVLVLSAEREIAEVRAAQHKAEADFIGLRDATTFSPQVNKDRDRLAAAGKQLLDALHRCTIVGIKRQPSMDSIQWTNPNGQRVCEAMDAMGKALAGGEVE